MGTIDNGDDLSDSEVAGIAIGAILVFIL